MVYIWLAVRGESAIKGGEPEADRCIAALEAEDTILISAGNLAESLIVAGRCRFGEHPAALNFGDCFAYELAKARGCRLLRAGDDLWPGRLGGAGKTMRLIGTI
jgi:uncharacterized protein with PIN domain